MAREGIFSDSKFLKFAELPGAAAPGPHDFARILVWDMKADRCLDKASPQHPNYKKIAAPGPITLIFQ